MNTHPNKNDLRYKIIKSYIKNLNDENDVFGITDFIRAIDLLEKNGEEAIIKYILEKDRIYSHIINELLKNKQITKEQYFLLKL